MRERATALVLALLAGAPAGRAALHSSSTEPFALKPSDGTPPPTSGSLRLPRRRTHHETRRERLPPALASDRKRSENIEPPSSAPPRRNCLCPGPRNRPPSFAEALPPSTLAPPTTAPHNPGQLPRSPSRRTSRIQAPAETAT